MRLRAPVAALAAVSLLLAGCGSDPEGGGESSAGSSTGSTAGSSAGGGSADTAGSGAGDTSGSGAGDSAGSSGEATADGGSEAAGSSSSDAATASTSGSAPASSSQAPTPGPAVPPATEVADPVAKDKMPTASGDFGDKPKLTFPEGNPPPSLQRQILKQGDGPAIKATDWLVGNYLGQVWGGEVFDNSYDRGKTSTFQIGTGKVVSGWDIGLEGVKLGSRVMLSLPPADGYGADGNPGAGIKGTDTLVFVIDLVDVIHNDQGGQTDVAKQDLPDGMPTVTGDLGSKPSIKVPEGLAEPTEDTVVNISTGTGDKVAENDQILVQYQAVTWNNEPGGSTWPTGDAMADAQAGLQQVPVNAQTPFGKLAGVTVGSRVLMVIAPTGGGASGSSAGAQPTPAVAVVLDVVAKA